MKNYKAYQLVLILSPFVFSFAFGLDIYIPIVPQMTEIFETTPALIQLTLSLFLFVIGAGQLFIGPFSDQFGRKKVFYTAAGFFAIGSLACAFSNHIAWLIIARVISAFGACGMLVTSFALVRDLYASEKSAKMYSFLNGAIGISPTFAPIIGGYLAVYLGWQSVFFFLTVIGLFSLLITRICLVETHPIENRVRIDSHVLQRYVNIFRNKQFITYSLLAGLGEGILFCFFSISPFIIIGLHGIPTEDFGYYFAVFGSVIGLGGLGSGKLVEKVGIPQTIFFGIVLMAIGGLSMFVWYFFNAVSLTGFLIPMALACTGAMFLVGGSASVALEPFGAIAGTAAAAFGALEFGLSALIGTLLMLFSTASTLPYACFILMMAVSSAILFQKDRKKTSVQGRIF